ncbi:MAG: AAA family ATPase [Angustibacter sp.]
MADSAAGAAAQRAVPPTVPADVITAAEVSTAAEVPPGAVTAGPAGVGASLLDQVGTGAVHGLDVARTRERTRRRRLGRLAVLGGLLCGWLWYRLLVGDPVGAPSLPDIDPLYLTGIGFFIVLIVVLLATTVVAGRSPHVLVRPEQIDVGLDDVVGIDVVKAEVVRSLNLFLAHRTYAAVMGGRPRRGILFEGPPGTGKTHTAKALAREAGVPFLMATATSFQSSLQGASQRQIRSFFRALRRAARQYGGAIGFIDEFDAIALRRPAAAASVAGATIPGSPTRSSVTSAGLGVTPTSAPGCDGLVGLPFGGASSAAAQLPGSAVSAFSGPGDSQMTVNELLVQLQSFDQPTAGRRLLGRLVDAVNLVLPAHRQLPGPANPPAHIMLLASTNTAERLDPALLRPGRFDQRLTFGLPDKAGRRQVVDHFLSRKAHDAVLDDPQRRDALAGLTQGYSPAMLEGLLDEALVQALAAGRTAMRWADVEHARMVTEIGLAQPVGYTDHERRLIATHEAGHATVAWLVAPQRRLEVLTIVKRRDALGLLAHGDPDEVFTRSRSELRDLIRIAFGGQVAEEQFFGDVSTGPAGDLQYATTVAAQMVGASGMVGTLVSYAAVQGSAFADQGVVGRVLSDTEGRRMVEELLQEQRQVVRDLLSRHRHLVAALRDALLDRHELIGHEITDVLEAARLAGPVEPAAALALAGAAGVDERTRTGGGDTAPGRAGEVDVSVDLVIDLTCERPTPQ